MKASPRRLHQRKLQGRKRNAFAFSQKAAGSFGKGHLDETPKQAAGSEVTAGIGTEELAGAGRKWFSEGLQLPELSGVRSLRRQKGPGNVSHENEVNEEGRWDIMARRSVGKAEQGSCRICDGTERGWGSHTQ